MYGINMETQTRVPEIEVNKTCSILVIPVEDTIQEAQIKILEYMAAIAFCVYVRKDDAGNRWEIYVIPGIVIPGKSFWQDIFSAFGNPKYYERVC